MYDLCGCDGNALLAACGDGSGRIFDAATGAQKVGGLLAYWRAARELLMRVLPGQLAVSGHDAYLHSVAGGIGAPVAVTGGADGRACVWDLRAPGAAMAVIESGWSWVAATALVRGAEWLVAGGGGSANALGVWHVGERVRVARMQDVAGSVNDIWIGGDGVSDCAHALAPECCPCAAHRYCFSSISPRAEPRVCSTGRSTVRSRRAFRPRPRLCIVYAAMKGHRIRARR